MLIASVHPASAGAGKLKARFENMAKASDDENKRRVEEERERRRAREEKERLETQRRQQVAGASGKLLWEKPFPIHRENSMRDDPPSF